MIGGLQQVAHHHARLGAGVRPEMCIRDRDDHRAGKHDNSRKIWTIYIFLVWYDIYFNGASHEPGDLPAVS